MSTNTTANTATLETPSILTDEGARFRLREIKDLLLVENEDRSDDEKLSETEIITEANRRLEAERQTAQEAEAERAADLRSSGEDEEEGRFDHLLSFVTKVVVILLIAVFISILVWQGSSVVNRYFFSDTDTDTDMDDSMSEFVDETNHRLEDVEQRVQKAEQEATAAVEAAKKAEADAKKQAEERELAAKADRLALEKKVEELEKAKKALEKERERVAEAAATTPTPASPSTATPTGSQPTLSIGFVMDNLESFTTDEDGNPDGVRREDRTIDDIFLGGRCTPKRVRDTKYVAMIIARGDGKGATTKVDPEKLASTTPSSRVKSVVKQQIKRDFKIVFLTADQIGGVMAMPDGKKVQLVPRNKITDLPAGERYVFLELL